jgi:hypothetical protein
VVPGDVVGRGAGAGWSWCGVSAAEVVEVDQAGDVRSAAAALLARTRVARGLPLQVDDEAVLRRVAAAVRTAGTSGG